MFGDLGVLYLFLGGVALGDAARRLQDVEIVVLEDAALK